MLPSCAGVRRLTPLLCALFVLQTLFASSLVAAYEHADCFATLNSADPLFYSVDLRNGERGGSVSDWRVKTYNSSLLWGAPMLGTLTVFNQPFAVVDLGNMTDLATFYMAKPWSSPNGGTIYTSMHYTRTSFNSSFSDEMLQILQSTEAEPGHKQVFEWTLVDPSTYWWQLQEVQVDAYFTPQPNHLYLLNITSNMYEKRSWYRIVKMLVLMLNGNQAISLRWSVLKDTSDVGRGKSHLRCHTRKTWWTTAFVSATRFFGAPVWVVVVTMVTGVFLLVLLPWIGSAEYRLNLLRPTGYGALSG